MIRPFFDFYLFVDLVFASAGVFYTLFTVSFISMISELVFILSGVLMNNDCQVRMCVCDVEQKKVELNIL